MIPVFSLYSEALAQFVPGKVTVVLPEWLAGTGVEPSLRSEVLEFVHQSDA